MFWFNSSTIISVVETGKVHFSDVESTNFLRGSSSGFTGFTGSLTAVDCVTYINYVPTPMGQGGIEVAEKNCQISTGYSSTILRSKSLKSMHNRLCNTDGVTLSCIEQRRFLSIDLH